MLGGGEDREKMPRGEAVEERLRRASGVVALSMVGRASCH